MASRPPSLSHCFLCPLPACIIIYRHIPMRQHSTAQHSTATGSHRPQTLASCSCDNSSIWPFASSPARPATVDYVLPLHVLLLHRGFNAFVSLGRPAAPSFFFFFLFLIRLVPYFPYVTAFVVTVTTARPPLAVPLQGPAQQRTKEAPYLGKSLWVLDKALGYTSSCL